jgi:hypothetical protein
MKKIGETAIPKWVTGLFISPIDGFFQIFAPIKHITTYQFDAWGELVDTLHDSGVKVTLNGYVGTQLELTLHILLYDNCIVGYATNPADPYSEGVFVGYRVCIDSDVPIGGDSRTT